jgi:predicted permease
MLADLRFALRQLVQSPGFAAVAVLSLALGIGANTAVFGMVNELFLRALPVRDPEELVIFRSVQGERGGLARSTDGYGGRDPVTGKYSVSSFPLGTLERFAARTDVLSTAFAFSPFWQCNVLVNGTPDIAATAQLASGDYHRGLGVGAWLGRTFLPEDDRPGADPVAVISHRFWQRNFGGAPDVIGRTIQLNKVSLTIIGVTPEAFMGAGQAGDYFDVTVPLAHYLKFNPESADKAHPWYWWVRLMGRLAPGVTREQAAAALAPVFAELAREGWKASPRAPGEAAGTMPGDPELRAEPGFQGENDTRRESARPLQIMLGLSGLVLLAACANVANLLLARGTARRREIAVRLALGASRARIVRQLLSEALLLAAAAAALGLLVAWASRGAVLALRPFNVAFTLPFDWRVGAFAAGAALLTTLVFGLAPALRATKLDLTAEFQGGRTGHGTRSWLSRALMVLQIALSLLLLVCTGLLIGSLRNLENVDAGFNRDSLAAFRIDPTSAGYGRDDGMAVSERLRERLAALPGVTGVTYTRVPVLSRSRQTSSVTVPGFTPPPGTSSSVHVHVVEPNFFAVLQLPVIHGRAFTDADGATGAKIAIVNQAFVQRYFPQGNPLGQRFKYGPVGEIEIVGVARDAKYADLRADMPVTVYFPLRQQPGGPANFLVRTQGDPAALFTAIRSTVRELDPTLPVLNLRTMDEQVGRLHAQERMFAKLSGVFGALVLTLSAVGLYGLISYAVARRTSEIGVRMALGALPRQILQLFLRESLALVLIGIVVGAFGAWGAAQLLTRMLFGLTATDPLTYGAAGLLLAAVALFAAAVPARRAARLEPTVALRTE